MRERGWYSWRWIDRYQIPSKGEASKSDYLSYDRATSATNSTAPRIADCGPRWVEKNHPEIRARLSNARYVLKAAPTAAYRIVMPGAEKLKPASDGLPSRALVSGLGNSPGHEVFVGRPFPPVWGINGGASLRSATETGTPEPPSGRGACARQEAEGANRRRHGSSSEPWSGCTRPGAGERSLTVSIGFLAVSRGVLADELVRIAKRGAFQAGGAKQDGAPSCAAVFVAGLRERLRQQPARSIWVGPKCGTRSERACGAFSNQQQTRPVVQGEIRRCRTACPSLRFRASFGASSVSEQHRTLWPCRCPIDGSNTESST